MDPEIAWQDLVAAALLGTERKPFAPPSMPDPLAELVRGLSGRDPEKALLGTAAALSLFRRAGRRPLSEASTAIEPSDLDERPRCSSRSDGHLALMLSGTHADVLPEWLDALNLLGKRPPEDALPDLLDLGRSKLEIRPRIVAAVGPLGAWLARQNPDWAYATGAHAPAVDEQEAESTWQTGSVEQRTTLLGRLRESSPDRARGLVASTWPTDSPEVRARFLEKFAIGLTLADEPFLEEALDDRRKEVRSAAADLLARLPGSGLVGRMVARVAPLLGFSDPSTRAILDGLLAEPGPPGSVPTPPRPFKEVVLLDVCDKSMVRDGVEPKFTRPGLGEKAGWLSQMIARVPPSAWSRAWGRSPAELAEAAVRGKWPDAIYRGLVAASALHGDLEWIGALLPHRHLAGFSFDMPDLLDTLPAHLQEAMVLAMLKAGDGEVRIRFRGDPLTEEQMKLLGRVPPPWGAGLSQLVLGRLVRNLSDKNHLDGSLVAFLKAAAPGLSPVAVLAAPPSRTVKDADVAGYLLQQVDRQLEAFHALIQFRLDMIQELRA